LTLPPVSSGGWDKNNSVGKHAGSVLTQKIATDGERLHVWTRGGQARSAEGGRRVFSQVFSPHIAPSSHL